MFDLLSRNLMNISVDTFSIVYFTTSFLNDIT